MIKQELGLAKDVAVVMGGNGANEVRGPWPPIWSLSSPYLAPI